MDYKRIALDIENRYKADAQKKSALFYSLPKRKISNFISKVNWLSEEAIRGLVSCNIEDSKKIAEIYNERNDNDLLWINRND